MATLYLILRHGSPSHILTIREKGVVNNSPRVNSNAFGKCDYFLYGPVRAAINTTTPQRFLPAYLACSAALVPINYATQNAVAWIQKWTHLGACPRRITFCSRHSTCTQGSGVLESVSCSLQNCRARPKHCHARSGIRVRRNNTDQKKKQSLELRQDMRRLLVTSLMMDKDLPSIREG